MDPQQADHLLGELLPRFIAPQQHNTVLSNAAMPPADSNVQLENQWENVVPPAQAVRAHGAVQLTPEDQQHFNVANHHLADYRELRDDPAVPYAYPNIGPTRGAAVNEQGYQGNHGLGYAPQGIVPGHTQPALPDRSAHQPHALGQPAVENLRRLASHYVHHPDSTIEMVRMEPGTVGRYKVVVVLEMMSDFL